MNTLNIPTVTFAYSSKIQYAIKDVLNRMYLCVNVVVFSEPFMLFR
jgi:hypothetical protein